MEVERRLLKRGRERREDRGVGEGVAEVGRGENRCRGLSYRERMFVVGG